MAFALLMMIAFTIILTASDKFHSQPFGKYLRNREKGGGQLGRSVFKSKGSIESKGSVPGRAAKAPEPRFGCATFNDKAMVAMLMMMAMAMMVGTMIFPHRFGLANPYTVQD